ncbi:cysteine peptidase family C39 domain-containing protein [Algoriphagus boritolerans]|uniref:cysteine peptidase family C39 domain-containing protein n=1 Tax=Algoriphagus boritolerans TaxID=308111 RepID=UPI000AB4BDC0|nr:cysteine peptidase family C39 domain-containing protein [Algoriphagus boritolerans]
MHADLKSSFPHYKQPDSKDCGPTCLRIIAKYSGKLISLKEIREISETTREVSSLLKLSDAAEAMGFRTIGAKLHFENLIKFTSAYSEMINLRGIRNT